MLLRSSIVASVVLLCAVPRRPAAGQHSAATAKSTCPGQPHRPTRRKTSRRRAPPSRIPSRRRSRRPLRIRDRGALCSRSPKPLRKVDRPTNPLPTRIPSPRRSPKKPRTRTSTRPPIQIPLATRTTAPARSRASICPPPTDAPPTGRRFRTALQSEARQKGRPDRRLLPRIEQLAGRLRPLPRGQPLRSRQCRSGLRTRRIRAPPQPYRRGAPQLSSVSQRAP